LHPSTPEWQTSAGMHAAPFVHPPLELEPVVAATVVVAPEPDDSPFEVVIPDCAVELDASVLVEPMPPAPPVDTLCVEQPAPSHAVPARHSETKMR
jgi:hypothetical protein